MRILKVKGFFYTVCACLLWLHFAFAQFEREDFPFQKGDSLYLEDQLFFSISFNNLVVHQKDTNLDQRLSYGIEVGFVKDIPINKRRNFGFGLGLNYSYQQVNSNLFHEHFLKQEQDNKTLTQNSFRSVELPFEIRWRTSTLTTYKFWRIYTGVKLSYIFSNNLSKDIAHILNPFHLIGAISMGNGLINFRVSYYFTSIVKRDIPNNPEKIQVMPWQIGLIFFGL